MDDLFDTGLCRFSKFGQCNIFIEPNASNIGDLVKLADSEYKTPGIEEEEEE